MSELIALRDHATAAQHDAETARIHEQAAAGSIGWATRAYHAAVQRATEARQKLDLIRDARQLTQAQRALEAAEQEVTR
jgi:hypothetical protein